MGCPVGEWACDAAPILAHGPDVRECCWLKTFSQSVGMTVWGARVRHASLHVQIGISSTSGFGLVMHKALVLAHIAGSGLSCMLQFCDCEHVKCYPVWSSMRQLHLLAWSLLNILLPRLVSTVHTDSHRLLSRWYKSQSSLAGTSLSVLDQ